MHCFGLVNLEQLDPEASPILIRYALTNDSVPDAVALALRQRAWLRKQLTPVFVLQNIDIVFRIVILREASESPLIFAVPQRELPVLLRQLFRALQDLGNGVYVRLLNLFFYIRTRTVLIEDL